MLTKHKSFKKKVTNKILKTTENSRRELNVPYKLSSQVETKDIVVHENSDIQTESTNIGDMLILQQDGRCINAFELISSPKILMGAYEILKSKPGMMTKGSDDETLDGITKEWFENMSLSIRSEKYKPKPSRRIYIPKPNGKTRPLGISSPRDRIVQQAMKMVMECLLEPSFSDCSHGFRPFRSCHTALKKVRHWNGVSWFIEGDIKSFFDNIDHHLLANLLMKHFDDTRLLNLYWKFVSAGYLEWDRRKLKLISSDVGVPQGGIISPLLSNLILHELDIFVENFMNKCEDKRSLQKIRERVNPLYQKAVYHVKKLTNKLLKVEKGSIEYRKLKKEIRNGRAYQRRLSTQIPHPKLHPTIKYVRYADDWLIGVWGNKKFATDLKQSIAKILTSLNLCLSEEKTLITNARSGKAMFLGTGIKKFASNKGNLYTKLKGTSRMVRISGGNIWMTAPIMSIVKRLEQKGFVITGDIWKAKAIKLFKVLPMKDIILRYRAIYNGFNNFYSFVDNKKLMSKVLWILSNSLRKTLSSKFDLSKYQIIAKYGQYFNCNYQNSKGENKNINFKFPELNRKPLDFKVGTLNDKDPLYAGLWNIRTVSSLDEVCASCGSDLNVEMHHLKHIKTLNVKLNDFDKQLAKINRKQVPLCRVCHNKVHDGEYKGLSLKSLKSPKSI